MWGRDRRAKMQQTAPIGSRVIEQKMNVIKTVRKSIDLGIDVEINIVVNSAHEARDNGLEVNTSVKNSASVIVQALIMWIPVQIMWRTTCPATSLPGGNK